MPARSATSRRLSSVIATLALSCAILIGLPVSAEALQRLTTGFSSLPDPASPAGTNHSKPSGAVWLQRAVSDQAGFVRVPVGWSGIAPATRPRGFAPSDPASPAYNFTTLDAQIKEYAASGLKILITITSAPRWAEGSKIPRGTPPGTWRPNAAQFGEFAKAIATRYSGHFPDPSERGADLPRVKFWQAWNEPNLNTYLSPQWVRDGRHYVAVSPTVYRSLENAFYANVKAVNRTNFVVMAGTAPFGDLPGGERMMPVAFYRSLFCLVGSRALQPAKSCPSTSFDAADHHPYGIGGPLSAALNSDDVSIPDIHKITRVLTAAEHDGRVLPRGPKPVWVTEYSWDSNPPDPHGVPIQTQARWLEQAMYVLWEQGVSTIFWLQIVDDPPIPSYAATYQAGLYFLSGAAKPAATAYRFPFVTTRLSKDSVRAWGRTPAAGTLLIQEQTGSNWKTVSQQHVGARQVFETNLRVTGAAVFRAVVAGQTSLTWSQSA